MFARCNLKVLGGTEISWVNWQSAPEFIAAGTPLMVSGGPSVWVLRDPARGRTYRLDAGAEGEPYLLKFTTPAPPREEFTPGVRDAIDRAVAAVGMSREEVYAAMGPPAVAGPKRTAELTYEQILGYDLWIYRRRTLGKNIGVRFHPRTNRVTETEGIWR